MNDLNAMRVRIGQTVNYSGMNQFDMEEAYADAGMRARDAWNEATEVNRAIQAQRATGGSYLSEMEDMDENDVPSLSELENAFTDAIKTFFSSVKDRIDSIIAAISKWIDDKLTDLDEKWWDKHSEKAFSSEADNCKDTIKVIDWDFGDNSGKLADVAGGYTKAIEESIKALETASSTPGKNVSSGYEKKSEEALEIFAVGGKYKTKVQKKISDYKDDSKMKEIFLRSRADRQTMKDFKKELEQLKKNIAGINANDFADADPKADSNGETVETEAANSGSSKAALATTKKTIGQMITFSKKAISLIMARRSDIKMIVAKRYSFAVSEQNKNDRKNK